MLDVQAWIADDPTKGGSGTSYETVTFIACPRVHVVDPTGKVLGADQ
jgi:hypothetical protein